MLRESKLVGVAKAAVAAAAGEELLWWGERDGMGAVWPPFETVSASVSPSFDSKSCSGGGVRVASWL